MDRDGIAALFLIVCVVGELATGFSSNTMHFLTGMALIAALNTGA